MTRLLFAIAFALGAAAILWMGEGFAGSAPLALLVTTIIGGVYLLGIIELFQYRRATASLTTAVESIPARTDDPTSWLEHWLRGLDPSLQNAARLRIEGDRAGLPAPVFTPYLVGLLVMLGLLGTFIGMVETLGGAVLALEGSTELEAIRAGLAAPIKGLGVAFGTSVAGVAASAMLGLISTLCRRERMLATRQLDHAIARDFREFSAGYQRQETLHVLQQQAAALPAVAERLQGLAGQLERMGQHIGERLQTDQQQFHESAKTVYTELAASVGESLRESLARAGREAGESMQPVVTAAMAGLQQDAMDIQQKLASTATGQLAALREEAAAANNTVLTAIEKSASSWSDQAREMQVDMAQAMRESSRELSASTASTSGQVLDEVGKLISANEELVRTRQASEQAWLTSQREQLAERVQVMEQLNSLADSMERTASRQRDAIEELVSSSSGTLRDISERFGEQADSGIAGLADVAAHFTGSAAELASLGEAFNAGVELFNAANGKLIENLARIEESMQASTERSDEQMGYYVAQAREIIDQSMLSQQGIIEDLRRLGEAGAPAAKAGAG